MEAVKEMKTPGADHRVEEYTAQYQQASAGVAFAFGIGIVLFAYSLFFPSAFTLIMMGVCILLVFAGSAWKVYLRTKMVDLGYARDYVNAWERQLKKDAAAWMLLALGAALVILALLAPAWYGQLKESVVFIPYSLR